MILPKEVSKMRREPSHYLKTNCAIYGISDVVRQIVSTRCPQDTTTQPPLQGRSHVMAWKGPGPCKIFFFHYSRLKKNQGPPNIGQLAPPCPILNYSLKSSSNILPSPALVLGLITLCTPNKTSQPAQVQTLKTKLHFLFISKFHPLTHGIPFFTSYSFVLSSLIHFHLHQHRCLPTSPKTPVLCTHNSKKIKKILTNFFFSTIYA